MVAGVRQKQRKSVDEICNAAKTSKVDAALSKVRSEPDAQSFDEVSPADVLAVQYVVVAHLRFDITVADPIVRMAKVLFKCLTASAALSTFSCCPGIALGYRDLHGS